MKHKHGGLRGRSLRYKGNVRGMNLAEFGTLRMFCSKTPWRIVPSRRPVMHLISRRFSQQLPPLSGQCLPVGSASFPGSSTSGRRRSSSPAAAGLLGNVAKRDFCSSSPLRSSSLHLSRHKITTSSGGCNPEARIAAPLYSVNPRPPVCWRIPSSSPPAL